VADGLQGAFVNIQGKGEQQVAVGSQGHQGLDQAPEQVHSADPDAAQTDGLPQFPQKVEFADVNPDEKEHGK
jgi:hypothetical protein